MKVLCIAPAWNEGARIGRVVRALPPGIVDEIVVVDDGSTDDTADHAERAGAKVIRQGVNRGVGAAIRAGYDHARAGGFDVAVVISGGGKTPPAQIPRLLDALARGADFAQGSRYVPGGEQVRLPLQRRVGTMAYSALFSALCRRWVTDASSGFRAIKMSLLEDKRIDLQQPWLDRYELEPYLLFQALRLGYRVQEVPVTIEYPQKDGIPYTKMRAVRDWWRIFRPAVFLAFGLRR
jgi:dolichol-phosphate mannosyltransferase